MNTSAKRKLRFEPRRPGGRAKRSMDVVKEGLELVGVREEDAEDHGDR